MYRTALLFAAICFILVGAASFFTASRAVHYLHDQTEAQLNSALQAAGQDWANIRADGLLVHLTGLAPDETARFRALEVMGQLIESSRIEDATTILQTTDIEPPRFSLEVLRNEHRISLIGLIPTSMGRDEVVQRLEELTQDAEVTDMLESANHTVPAGWEEAVDFGLSTLEALPRSKISITPEAIGISAVTESVLEQRNLEVELRNTKPENIVLNLDISAPRPVIAPFRLRMKIEGDRVELSSCSVDTEDNRQRILRAAIAAGLPGPGECQIGLGVPTTEWTSAVAQSIAALAKLGSGTLTFTDSDIALVAGNEVAQVDFDNVVGPLENSLPDLFSLLAILPPKPLDNGTDGQVDVPRFIAKKSGEGRVLLLGRVPDELTKSSIETYASALYGASLVTNEARVSENVPDGWPIRVLAGLEALQKLHEGTLTVEPEKILITGQAPRPDATAEVSRILSVRIGGKGNYKIDIGYNPDLFVVDEVPSHEECEQGISAALNRKQIKFSAGSVTIEKESLPVLDEIAEILRKCVDAEFIIEGHTDSQGSEELNKRVSQARAESVVTALMGRRVLTSGLTAVGYGEEQPIADNETEEGRDLNRRIVFRLKTDDDAAIIAPPMEEGAETAAAAETEESTE